MNFEDKEKKIINDVYHFLTTKFVTDYSQEDGADNDYLYVKNITTQDIRIDFTKKHFYANVDKFHLDILSNHTIMSDDGKPLIRMICISMGLGYNGSIPNRRIINPPIVEENRPLPVVKVVTDFNESLGNYAQIVIPLINLRSINSYKDVIKCIHYGCIGKRFVCMQDIVNDNINLPFIISDYRIGDVVTAFKDSTNILINSSRIARLSFDIAYNDYTKGMGDDWFCPCHVDSMLNLLYDCVYNRFSYKELINKYYNSLLLPNVEKLNSLYNSHTDGIYFSIANYIISTTEFRFLTVVNSSIGQLPDYVLASVAFRKYDKFSIALSKKVRSLSIYKSYKDIINSDDDILVRNIILMLVLTGATDVVDYQLEFMTLTFPSKLHNVNDDGPVRSYTFLLWLQRQFHNLKEFPAIKKIKEEIDEARIYYKS